MLDIDEMNTKEMHELLQKVGHGHLGCSLEGHPYVVPMHYFKIQTSTSSPRLG